MHLVLSGLFVVAGALDPSRAAPRLPILAAGPFPGDSKLQADAEWEAAGEEINDSALHDSAVSAVAKEETIEWWVVWLTLEDQMPNELSGSIGVPLSG